MTRIDRADKKFKGTVLVAGATGRTGRWVVRRLQAHGIDYRLFVRTGSKAIEYFGPECTDRLVSGSIENQAELETATSGCSAVISAIGAYVTDPDAPPPSTIDRDGMSTFAKIARSNGVRRFIQVTSLAVTRPEHPMNNYGEVLSMKLQGENAIRSIYSRTGYSYTILRPGGLQDGEPFRHDLRFGTGDILTGVIDRSDLAEAAVVSLWHPKASNMTFELIRGEKKVCSSFEHYFEQLP
ncbi:MAG: SDR family oxidoreductase [Chlorobiaceae bacterium]|nr:SDR family oxidoreductase [Chlorobiaceae bacterium]NTV60505.1 SDR family oxidoreductase [Chlorobiaceae bacterium]